MVRRFIWIMGVVASVAACRAVPDSSGDPVGTSVVPPNLARVSIEPFSLERSEVVRIALKEPQALPPTQADQYVQTSGVVDILWVIDDSGQMANNRTLLAGNFTAFFDEIGDHGQVDFNIGVISANGLDQGVLHGPIISKDTPDAGAVFLGEVTYPQGRVAWVQSLAMMKLALTTANTNIGFPRPNAALGVIAISNADDQSFGGVPYFARFLRGVKGQGNENLSSFSTISGDLPKGCQPAREAQYFGSYAGASIRLTQMATLSGGVIGSICDNSFQNSLTRIAQALNTLRKVFPLSLKPDPSTIQVLVDGAAISQNSSNGWTYVAALNAIEFLGSYVPPPGSKIDITYAISQ